MELALLRRTFETWWPQLEESLLELQHAYEHESTTGYDRLYRPSDLSPIQINTNCKSLWVVIPIMRHALQTTCVKEVVEYNIQRGVKYYFILPHRRKKKYIRQGRRSGGFFRARSGEKEIHELPLQEFKKLAVIHLLMLNPKVEDEHPLRVFFESPVVGEHNYWIEVEKEAAYTFVERFDAISAKTEIG